MAKSRRQQLTSARDVDLLLLIREEEVYADRIRGVLVFSETKFQRLPAPLVSLDDQRREARRLEHMRPLSAAEKEDEISADFSDASTPASQCSGEAGIANLAVGGSTPYVNPVDLRRTVDDDDAIFSKSSTAKGRVEFTYDDLVATREGRKVTTVRALRRLANLWQINPKLNKEEMLTELIGEYARRYEDEVEAYKQRRSTPRIPKRVRRQPRRR